ncbi:peptidase domain-containing ABC transporter [Mucilaginibacter sp.]|uniref:peptidase domain-containing ABC transporter n=1 Tax=Mucilaginibacter sp. TaxID=1882438 RepID=UPI0025DB8EA7|nr:peptidase domain-containing ABC transporter [Mucilaginibacter sp.]
MRFPFYHQRDGADCGPTCLRMIAKFYGKKVDSEFIKRKTFGNKEGVNLLDLSQAAKSINFDAVNYQLTFEKLIELAVLPCILFWGKNHFVILYKIKQKKNGKRFFLIADPSLAKITLNEDDFKSFFLPDNLDKGFCLFLEPNEEFDTEEIRPEKQVNIWKFLLSNIKSFRSQFILIFLLTAISSIFAFILPFINKDIIDVGIKNKSVKLIEYLLFFQLFFFLANTLGNTFRAYILLHTGTSINIKIVTDFLYKVLKLPIYFFESKTSGDIIQRISDNKRVEDFVSNQFIGTFFSLVNLAVFMTVLIFYDIKISLVFALGSALSVTWTIFFLGKRKTIDYKRFRELSENNDEIYEIVRSMPEIKLNSFESYKANQWKKIQNKMFHINISTLFIDQVQNLGADSISQIKNIIITFLAAYSVVQGHMTLGVLLSISYIIGQLNVPITQLTAFITTLQTVGFSLQRLNEVHNQKDEDEIVRKTSDTIHDYNFKNKISISNLSFQYGGKNSPYVLKDVNLEIPIGKVTAIVGTSGSGKSTLLKLLLKLYNSTEGEILIDDVNLKDLSPSELRSHCGVVMQDGVIFSDTILRNIVMGNECDENADRLLDATKTSRIHDFIMSLPLKYKTKIGTQGVGLSEGQKQRILISRAIFRNPKFLFLDEATSYLDAENEKIITDGLSEFYTGKTVIIVAHRLSTVKNADKIIVLNDGTVIETGTHKELVHAKGRYFNLIKNQLELGR